MGREAEKKRGPTASTDKPSRTPRRSPGKRPTRASMAVWGSVALVLAVAAILLGVYWWPHKLEDPLCKYIRRSGLTCVALVADAESYRPGGVTKLFSNEDEPGIPRAALPSSYLDSKSCLIPGASLGDVRPNNKDFALSSFEYNSGVLALLHGRLAKGLTVNPRAANVDEVDLSFGPAHTYLVDESDLVAMIGKCEIKPYCVDLVKKEKNSVINRVVVADGITYTFRDARGADVPITALQNSKALSLTGKFEATNINTTSLKGDTPVAVGVELVNDLVLSTAPTCTLDYQDHFEGQSKAFGSVGGGSNEQGRPATAGIGSTAQYQAHGSETVPTGSNDRSFFKSKARVDKERDNELALAVEAEAKGGLDEGKALASGVATPRDTEATGTALVEGAIQVLFRRANGRLTISWLGFPRSGDGIEATNSLEVRGPDGAVLANVRDPVTAGSQQIDLRGEGQYAVRGRINAEVVATGPKQHRTLTADARVKVQVAVKTEGTDIKSARAGEELPFAPRRTGGASPAGADPVRAVSQPVAVSSTAGAEESVGQRLSSKFSTAADCPQLPNLVTAAPAPIGQRQTFSIRSGQILSLSMARPPGAHSGSFAVMRVTESPTLAGIQAGIGKCPGALGHETFAICNFSGVGESSFYWRDQDDPAPSGGLGVCNIPSGAGALYFSITWTCSTGTCPMSIEQRGG